MMHVVLDKEEAALRRRALFRLLRRFDFDAPKFLGEAISAPVPDNLSAPEYLPARAPVSEAPTRSRDTAQACISKIAGPGGWRHEERGYPPRG